MTLTMPNTVPSGILFTFLITIASCSSKPAEQPEKELLGSERSLFDGHSLAGWHIDVPAMDSDATAKNPFIIRDSLLVSLGTPGGHLITDSSYSNYVLDIEYRFAGEPGNCGVLVHASKPRALYSMFPKSIEVQ